jgi:hypothetical protein
VDEAPTAGSVAIRAADASLFFAIIDCQLAEQTQVDRLATPAIHEVQQQARSYDLGAAPASSIA